MRSILYKLSARQHDAPSAVRMDDICIDLKGEVL